MNAAINTLKRNDNNNKCDKCNQRIHPNFIGHHKCGYANCAICKDAITNSEYWSHIRSHPGHENDSPPPRRTAFENRPYESKSTRYDGRNNRSISKPRFDTESADTTQLQVGKEYEVDITQIGDHGDGIARIQGRTIFVRGANIGEHVKIMITEIRSRIAIARTT
jgi:predicted RNA-binding protein with TRAM domain